MVFFLVFFSFLKKKDNHIKAFMLKTLGLKISYFVTIIVFFCKKEGYLFHFFSERERERSENLEKFQKNYTLSKNYEFLGFCWIFDGFCWFFEKLLLIYMSRSVGTSLELHWNFIGISLELLVFIIYYFI